jgi:arylsulfatase A-like enzyme
MLSVPLVVHLPGGAARGTRVATLARQIDVAPTLLTVLGLGVPPAMQGLPLLVAPDGVAEEALSRTSLRHDDLLALTTADWKIVHDLRRRTGPFALYAVRDDPDEAHDRAAEHPVLVGYGRETLLRAAADVPRPRRGEAPAIDANTARRLRALGYGGQ